MDALTTQNLPAEIQEALEYCPNLPTMSAVAMRVVQLGRQREVDFSELSETVAKDAALSSRILRVSNSPVYARGRQSNNLLQALSVLGLNAAMTLALSFSLADTMRHQARSKQIVGYVWRRGLLAAIAGRQVGRMMGRWDLEELFLAGLLQDIGILALEVALGDRYGALLADTPSHCVLLERERQTLGCDHGEAGAWLMQRWGLPEYLPLVAIGSHQCGDLPPDAGIDSDFVACVRIAGRLADIFSGSDPEAETELLAGDAAGMLGMDRNGVQGMLEAVSADVPEVERLFETEILSAKRATGILDQAREILAARNLALLQEVADQQRRATKAEESTRLLREHAQRDALTGLYNRRYLDERLDEEFSLARKKGQSLSLGFLDLDHFKEVNDIHGHVIGDQVLTRIAEILRAHLRPADFVARYGGEEFVVLLPGTDRDAARAVFERLRIAVAEQVYCSEDGRQFQVTTSVGVAADIMECESPLDMVRAADRALYDAKSNGRNRVEFYTAVL
ncbi:MAG: GGDEF domain-containing protein [Ectothiorhodospiraceae bacterium]|nr:GGDEF domain-containing protein [Ectothiorhodospiraceae bacterium]